MRNENCFLHLVPCMDGAHGTWLSLCAAWEELRDLHSCGSFPLLDPFLQTNGCPRAGLEPYNHIHSFFTESKNLVVFQDSHISKWASHTLSYSTHLLVAPLALTSHTDPSHLAPFPSPQVSFCLSKFLPISSPSSPPTSPLVSPGAGVGWGKDGLVLQSPTGGCESNSADVLPVMRSSVNAFSPHRNQQPQNYCVFFFYCSHTAFWRGCNEISPTHCFTIYIFIWVYI